MVRKREASSEASTARKAAANCRVSSQAAGGTAVYRQCFGDWLLQTWGSLDVGWIVKRDELLVIERDTTSRFFIYFLFPALQYRGFLGQSE